MIGKKETKVKYTTLSENLNITVQKFLSLFEINSDSKDFSLRLKDSNYLYIPEAQIPDCLLKTRKSINRNFCFLFENLEIERKQRKNTFSKVSYVVRDNYDLYKNSLNLNNIETSENGVKIIPFDPFNEEMEIKNKNNLKISLEKKNSNLNSEQKNSKNVPNQKPLEIKIDLEEIFNSLDGQNNHKKINLEEIKKWFITTSSAKNIGPYNGKEMLECLKHILIENSLIKNSENSKGFMICDSESDIYYKPEVAIEIIQREISESTSTLLEKKYNFEKQIKLNNLQFPSHIMHNMLHPTTHLHSQNLIGRRFHEYFGIYNHSSIKNKFDLIEPKFDFKNLQNITFENKLQSLSCAPKEKENFDFSNHKKNMLNFRKKSNENSRNKFDYPNVPLNFNSNIYNKKGQKLEQSIYNYK